MTTYSTTRAVATPAGYDQVWVGGVNVTYFRGIETVIGETLLTEPFAYGPMTLELPQVDGNHEAESFGTGDLSWIRDDAPVVIQRVDDPNAATPTVLATDYRGLVMGINVDGRDVTLEVGGQFSGAASTVYQHDPLIRRVKDVGFWAANALQRLNLIPSPRSGPVTGIEIPEGGAGNTLDAWASEVCAWSQTTAGALRAIMPTVWGGDVWGFATKDTTTKHVTLFTDDARVVARLRRDKTAVPTTWFGTGVTPDGVRWRNARYPGVFQGPPPTFPGSMTVGTLDGDTTTGSGVTVLHEKLVSMGYMGSPASYPAYTSATAAAVRELQDDAGLTKTGDVNSATWDALFDISVTGYSVADAHVAPLLQDPRVRELNRSANGSVIGRNPLYDATVKPVERFIDFGPGVTKAQAIAWCRGEYARLSAKNWFGEVTLNGGFGGFIGEWAPGSAPTDADIMSQLDIRPGMNAWLPMFDGGTLVHIAGVSVDRRSRRVTLTVDTLARDLLDVHALNERKKEASRSIRREFFAANRPTKASGNMVTCDELFGILDRNIDLVANEWNVFPVIAGQQGQVNRVKIRLTNDQAEFAVAVLSKPMTREGRVGVSKRLRNKVGNPLTMSDESVWESESLQDWFENDTILYAVGDGKQPCGYAPRRRLNDALNATGAPITGRHDDRATWPYICAAGTAVLVYVAIYPDRACTVKKGQILWPQLDDAN